MRLKSLSVLLTLLMISVSGLSQNMPSEWEKYTREDYFVSVRQETNSKKVKENEFLEYLLGLARTDLARQINIRVNDTATLEKKSESGITNISYQASSNFSSDVTLRFVETRSYYDKKKKTGWAIAWISKAELQRVYKEREAKIVALLDAADKAKREFKYDVALKYAYWALILNATLPETTTVFWPAADPLQPAMQKGSPASIVARDCITDILSGLRFRYLGTSEAAPLIGRLEVSCHGNAVSSLDYTYNDGLGLSGRMQVKDGIGVVELRSGMDVRNVDIQVEYIYPGDAEIKLALNEVAKINFPEAYFAGVSLVAQESSSIFAPVASTAKSATQQLTEALQAGFENVSSDNAQPIVVKKTVIDGDYIMVSACQVLDAVKSQKYSSVRKLFTSDGYAVFDKLVRYGRARVVDRENLQAVKYADGWLCRSVPMVFSFKTNNHAIQENLAFWFNAEGKIENLTFALEGETVKGILSKSQWTDGAKVALISFLENYKTAFALARLDYISSIFSEDALIVTGRLVKKTRVEGGIRLQQDDIEYNRYTKSAYMAKLKKSFSSKEYINLQFANSEIYRLTRGGKENLYGIQLKQDYYSSNYNDTGYLYLLVDMEDSRKPLIYVRTWQPQPDPDFGLYGPGTI